MTDSRRVFCIGETVLDIIFQDNNVVAAKPGGSMLNTAVSLGRAGIPVYFISDYAKDHAGDLIHNFLSDNGISTEYISRYPDGKTSLALAFLDQKKNADYSFYKLFPEERITISMPSAQAGDIVLFGSFYALTGSLRPKIVEFIRSAKSNGAFIIYDPNFRNAHRGELEAFRPWIIENISMASLVRGSDEDFLNIFAAANADQAYQHIKTFGCPMLVYTRNSQGVEVIANGTSRTFAVPPIQVASTIGAGDAFNAGIIYALLKGAMSGLTTLTGPLWDDIIGHSIQFSSDVCQSLENYISIEFGMKLKSETIR
jgi:fructokinase